MPDDELRNAIHGIVARLQSDFEAELGRLRNRLRAEKDAALSDARVQADARAAEEAARSAEAAARAVEVEWSAKLDAARADWQVRLQADLDEQKAEAERRLAVETSRVRAEVEQAAVDSANRVREEMDRAILESTARVRDEMEQAAMHSSVRLREEMEEAAAKSTAGIREEMEQALTDERARAIAIEAERTRGQRELAAERDRLAGEIEAERQAARALAAELEQAKEIASQLQEARTAIASLTAAKEVLTDERDSAQTSLASLREAPAEPVITAALVAERQAQLDATERLLAAVRTLDSARTLTDTLTALTSAAGTLAPRAALLVVNGEEIHGWRAAGFPGLSPASLRLPTAAGGLLATAITSASAVSTAQAPAPAFAALPAGRAGLAIPVIVGGQTVAVLYADDGVEGESEAPAAWPEAMQILAAHASACVSKITAMRITQAMRVGPTTGAGRPAATEDESSARRYARLLVSEIKLYNESAVRLGREKRDILSRLRPEINRARRLFDERVSPSLGARATYFQEELVHTLADGDSELLGSA
jgi:hypothetical protein